MTPYSFLDKAVQDFIEREWRNDMCKVNYDNPNSQETTVHKRINFFAQLTNIYKWDYATEKDPFLTC